MGINESTQSLSKTNVIMKEDTTWKIERLKETREFLLLKINHLNGYFEESGEADYVIGYLWDAVYEIDDIVKENEKKS